MMKRKKYIKKITGIFIGFISLIVFFASFEVLALESSSSINAQLKSAEMKGSVAIPNRTVDGVSTKQVGDSVDPYEQEQTFLFALDLVASFKYMMEARVQLMSSDQAIFYIMTMKERRLQAAINRLQSWRNSRVAKIRRMSEDIVVAILDLIEMKKAVNELTKKCAVASGKENQEYCNAMENLLFGNKVKSEGGTYQKLIRKFDDISYELPMIITSEGVSRSSNADVSLAEKIVFKLNRKQLNDLYAATLFARKETAEIKDISVDMRMGFFLTAGIICNYLNGKQIFPLDPCSL